MNLPGSLVSAWKRMKFSHRLLSLALPVALLVFLVFQLRARSETVAIRKGDLLETVYGLATVKANRVYNLRVGVPSRIRRLYVQQGDEVQAGSPLAEFDEMPATRSPFAGVVTTLNYNNQEIVFPQMTILTVTDFSDRYLLVSLEEQGALRIRKGQTARVSFEGLPSSRFDCSVAGLFPDEGQFQVRVYCKDLPREILPGMTADVLIEVGKKNGVLLVPLSALRENRTRVIRGSQQMDVQIQTGSNDGEFAEVKNGDIREGDLVSLPGPRS